MAVARFLTEVGEHASALRDCGPALLIEAQDSPLAHLLANERSLRGLCLLAGDRYLAVPAESEASFRRALRKLGYGLPMRKAP